MVIALNQPAESADISVKELAALLGVSMSAAYRLLEEGKVNHSKPAGIIKVERADALRYKAETTFAATHPKRSQHV